MQHTPKYHSRIHLSWRCLSKAAPIAITRKSHATIDDSSQAAQSALRCCRNLSGTDIGKTEIRNSRIPSLIHQAKREAMWGKAFLNSVMAEHILCTALLLTTKKCTLYPASCSNLSGSKFVQDNPSSKNFVFSESLGWPLSHKMSVHEISSPAMTEKCAKEGVRSLYMITLDNMGE